MTQQEKTRLLNDHMVQYEKIIDLISSVMEGEHEHHEMVLLYLQLTTIQNQIIILNQTPVTNDIQNPIHY